MAMYTEHQDMVQEGYPRPTSSVPYSHHTKGVSDPSRPGLGKGRRRGLRTSAAVPERFGLPARRSRANVHNRIGVGGGCRHSAKSYGHLRVYREAGQAGHFLATQAFVHEAHRLQPMLVAPM
eukprot:scaffold827_cov369-Prasinococcus_capsulatus_cf.AAC.11